MTDEARLIRQKITESIHEATKSTAEEDTFVVPARLAAAKRLIRGRAPAGHIPNDNEEVASRIRGEFAAEVCFARLGARNAKTRLLTLHLIHFFSVRSAAFRLWWLNSLPRLQLLITLCTGWFAPTNSVAAAERAAATVALPPPRHLWPLLRTRVAAVAEEWVSAYSTHVPTVRDWVRFNILACSDVNYFKRELVLFATPLIFFVHLPWLSATTQQHQWLLHTVKLDTPQIIGRAHGLRLSRALTSEMVTPTVDPANMGVAGATGPQSPQQHEHSASDEPLRAVPMATEENQEGEPDTEDTEIAMARLLALHSAVLASAEGGQQQPTLGTYAETLDAKAAARAERRFSAAQLQVSRLERAAGTRGVHAASPPENLFYDDDEWGAGDNEEPIEENIWQPAEPADDE